MLEKITSKVLIMQYLFLTMIESNTIVKNHKFPLTKYEEFQLTCKFWKVLPALRYCFVYFPCFAIIKTNSLAARLQLTSIRKTQEEFSASVWDQCQLNIVIIGLLLICSDNPG